MKSGWPVLGLLLLAFPSSTGTSMLGSPEKPMCEASPTQDLLPHVVAPMTGASPVWLVDGGSRAWSGGQEPVKTLWVLRRTSDPVRISGQRLDGPGYVKLRRGSDVPSEILFVANPSRESVVPGGAPPEVMRSYAFLPSHVFYPSAGCWQFTIRIDEKEFQIVRELNETGPARAGLFSLPPNRRLQPTARGVILSRRGEH
jgi:hypothetical protein